jgi:cytochrome c biogenesis protein CcmG/thiol:disulfide interchange protein DsbE
MRRKLKWRTFCCAAGLAALCVTWLAACGKGGSDYGSKPPDYKAALAGAPKPLAGLYAQPNELLHGGTDTFQSRLAALRGYPVVVNKWASWCGPCRAEFPFFQRLSAKLGKRVAFLGVDANDSDDAAKTFLGEFPVPYPSYTDPEQKIAELLKATLGFPSTAFYDSQGKLVYTRQGGYAKQRDLLADNQRYGLSG